MSWKKIKLAELCNMNSGGTPSRAIKEYYIGDIPWAKISDIESAEGGIIKNTEEHISKAGLDSINNRIFPKGTLLLAMYGSVGKAAFTGIEMSTNQAILGIRIKDENILDYSFLKYWFQTIKAQLLNRAVGGTLQNISLGIVKDLEIPVPPLPIQKRIVEILDAADALRRKDQELLRKYDELAQAIFIDMFGDPVKNEKGFITIKLGDCLKNIQIGPFGTQLHQSDYIKNGIPLINPMHIGDLKIKPNHNYSISEKKYLELPQYHLKVDDVILGRRGEMGRCAIVTEEQGKCLCGTGSLFLTVKKELLDPLFLVYVLSRKTTKIALENVSAGTTMANLNKNIISDFEIIRPDIAKQKDFVNAIKMSEQSIEFTNQLVNKSNHIFESLLQQAFKGGLVK